MGYTAAEAIGQPITILIPPEHLYEEQDILTRIRRGERVEHYETVRVRKDGRRIDISLTVSPVRNARGILGDPERFQQIIANLVTNAVKFTPSGGRVDVRAENDATHAEIVVSDTGQGIAPSFLPHVFEAFRQAEGRASRRHGGLGLGLAVVRHLVELHGGTVKAKSPGLGQGARFTVRLPLLKGSALSHGL